MNDGFTKLFSSILTSSIWSEDDKTRILWITILALTNQDGYCAASIPGLATMARLSVENTVSALAKLEAPDPYSRTASNEGRRLQKVDGGWLVLNHGMYRDRERAEKRREYMRELMANKRLLAANDANKMITGDNLSASAAVSLSDDSSKKGVQGETKPTFMPPFIGFDAFWSTWPKHPRKVDKPKCLKTWKRDGLESRKDEVIAALEAWKRSDAWTKDGGQFIPAVTTWLNQRRYDDLEAAAAKIKPTTQNGKLENHYQAEDDDPEAIRRRNAI